MPPRSIRDMLVRAVILWRSRRGDVAYAGTVAFAALACGFVVSRLV